MAEDDRMLQQRSTAEACADEMAIWLEELVRLDTQLRQRNATPPTIPAQRDHRWGRVVRRFLG